MTYGKSNYKGGNNALVARVKRVERKVRLNSPEIKRVVWSYSGGITENGMVITSVTDIAQGIAIGNRIGDKIRVLSVHCRGLSNPQLDCYLIQSLSDADPGISSFTSDPGARLLASEHGRFKELVYTTCKQSNNNSPISYGKKFRGGLVVNYNGASAGACVKNALTFVFLNRAGGTLTPKMTMEMIYTDA